MKMHNWGFYLVIFQMDFTAIFDKTEILAFKIKYKNISS